MKKAILPTFRNQSKPALALNTDSKRHARNTEIQWYLFESTDTI